MAFSTSRSSTGPSQPMVEINTTPLVDVMLVLLVIFIITAPLFQQAVPIDLPKVDAARIDEKPRAVQVALDADGKISVDGEWVAMESLGERLHAAISPGESAPEMHLRADRATRYDRVTAVMAAAQRNGITKIAFVTEGENHGGT